MSLTGMLARGRIRVKVTGLPRAWRWAAVAGWMAGIFYLSHQAAPLGATANDGQALAAHLALYAGLALLLSWALAGAATGACPRWLVAGLAFALAVLYGATDEVHQAFVPGRSASEADLALDAAGAFLGAATAYVNLAGGLRWPR